MKRILIPLLALNLSSCSILGDRRVAAGCQVADGLTTYYALKHGAIESNTLISGLSPGGILLLKIAFAYIIYTAMPPVEKATNFDKFTTGAVAVMGCLPAASNLNVISKLPK